MYKGIGQYFPFHVEMNPFQKGQNLFHPWLHCEDFWEAALSLKCAQKEICPIRKLIWRENQWVYFEDFHSPSLKEASLPGFQISEEALKQRGLALTMISGGSL